MGNYQKDLRELLRDESLSKRQQLTIRLLYRNYAKRQSTYWILVLLLGWLGIHRYYANSDLMNGLMSPFCLSFPVAFPAILLSQSMNVFYFGLAWLAVLYTVAFLEIPFHLGRIRRRNTHLKLFLEEHVKQVH